MYQSEPYLNPKQECHFEQNALQLTDGNVIDCTGAKFAIKLFGSQTSEVVNVVRPQVKNIIPTESVTANVLIQTIQYLRRYL